ncbi:MAG: sensor histidine kinase [Chitinophagaceae bacterium]
MPLLLRNWRTWLALLGICIVSATIIYSNYLAKKIAAEERLRVQQWADAQRFIAASGPETNLTFATEVVTEQTTIPVIETDEKDSIIRYINIQLASGADTLLLLAQKQKEFARQNPPVVVRLTAEAPVYNRYYYGESNLLKQVRYYPMVQLLIVALFIIITLVSIHQRNKSAQNLVWAGMAKETAHQLGTPVSSLEGWVEMLMEKQPEERIVQEMRRDVERLKLVSDRFGKIGSTPMLEEVDVVAQIQQMVEYMKRRAPEKVQFVVAPSETNLKPVALSPQLFDWVIENLLKNALDAMDGQGSIKINVQEAGSQLIIEVSDTGRGIPKSAWETIFKPGYSTKKRGWGLGLSLSRRIVTQYHGGQLAVKHSEPGRGTTFKITIPYRAKTD